MATSLYTIDVGPRLADGSREVTLNQEGKPFFTVRHREVISAFLAFFPEPRPTVASGKSEAPTKSHVIGHRFDGGSHPPRERRQSWRRAQLEGGVPDSVLEAILPTATRPSGYEDEPADSVSRHGCEYLCVFHEEELCDSRGYYEAGQPQTLCTIYRAKDGTFTELALPNIAPSRMVPGLSGIFVQGMLQRIDQVSDLPAPLSIDGDVLYPVVDLWWMASPLVVKPVYVPAAVARQVMEQSANDRAPAAESTPGAGTRHDSFQKERLSIGSALTTTGIDGVYLDTEIIGHFRGAADEWYAIARTSGQEVRLARTKCASAFDVLCWAWLPQRCELLGLGEVDTASLVLVAPHSPCTSAQVLFVTAPSHERTWVIRTPHLQAETGTLETLLILPIRVPPVVLPSIRPQTPPAVLLCNSPQEGSVSLMSVPALLQFDLDAGRVSAAQMEALLLYTTSLDALVLPNAAAIHTPDEIAIPSGTIQAVSLVRGPQLVFTTTVGAATTSSSPSDSGAQWRRCEVSRAYTVNVPGTTGHAARLLVILLDALQAALGADAATTVEYAYVSTRWTRRGEALDSLASAAAIIAEVLLDIVDRGLSRTCSLPSPSPTVGASHKSPDCGVGGVRALVAAVECPLMLTASTLSRALAATGPSFTSSPSSAPCATTSTAFPQEPVWSRAKCEWLLVTLHLVCESCTMQERFWVLVPALADMVLRVSQRLGRSAYTDCYSLKLPLLSVTPSAHTNPVPKLSDSDVAEFSQLCGARCVLVGLCTPGKEDGVCDGGAARVLLVGAPPLARLALVNTVRGNETAEGTGWPMLRGLPLSHPLSVTNRVYCLLVTCFARWPSTLYQPVAGQVPNDDDAAASALDDENATITHSSAAGSRDWRYRLCEWLSPLALSHSTVREQLPLGTGFPIAQALACAKECPAKEWSETMHAIVGRVDCIRDPALLDTLTDHARSLIRVTEERATTAHPPSDALRHDDGVSVRADFQKTWSDARLDVPQIVFNTAAPIALPSQVEGSDELFSTLNTLSRRAMSLPIGRGMLTLNTQNFKARDTIPVPALNLNGVTTDGIHVTNSSEEAAADRLLWPVLHSGCAAGLRFLPLRAQSSSSTGRGGTTTADSDNSTATTTAEKASALTRQWIVYQTQSVTPPPARAGMLLAAGVLGHLRVLQLTDIYALLVSQQPNYAWREVTTTAVMLGLGCSFRGTGSDLIFRCLSMHVRSLTPTTEDIEVSLDVQTAALLSMGMLCEQMPTNVFLVEMFLQEMSRLPSDEHCMKREGYALSAGMGLGLLLLGVGDAHAIQHVDERLFNFMDGARREAPPSVSQGMRTLDELGHDRDHFLTRTLLAQNAAAATSTSTCTKVFEGAHYNLGVSAPAAVMALGLIHLRTENELMATRLAPPDRLVALQAVSPLLCLLRSTMAPLVCWNSIEPTQGWLYAHVPQRLVALGKHGHASIPLAHQQVNYLLLNLGHCIAGTAMALAIRYAGSMDADARLTILSELQGFARGVVGTTGVAMTTFQKATGAFEKCIATCAVAVSLVMAGSGDVKVLAELRRLHARNVTYVDIYGTNMAIASAMGLLFLGSGRLTLSTSLPSVAALLIAFYPVWPAGPEDNVHHLQAFRHLYALAVVPRLMETMDAVTGRPVSVPIRLVLRKGRILTKNGVGGGGLPADQHVLWTPVPRGKEEQEVCLQTPCLLPPSETIESVEIRSTTHYPLVITNQHAHAISDKGLVVRVLEKEDARSTELSRAIARVGPAVGTAEVRLMDWLRRLLKGGDALCTPSSLILLSELSLLLAVSSALSTDSYDAMTSSSGGVGHRDRTSSTHKAAATPPLATGPHRLLRHDFLLPLRDALERRYHFLFWRGPPGCSEGHPLHALLIQCLCPSAVLDQVAAHPQGSRAFPCCFTNGSHGPRRANMDQCDNDQVTCGGNPCAARQWLAEALCFFGIAALLFPLRTVLAQEHAMLRRPATRCLALLKVNRSVPLPMRTLESIVRCCYDAEAL